ncbi:myb-like protein X [Drosophila ananassae]|uniref:myb-like protein X n=1 Tax=Drosophila ananassae TaxID=7217 RepID=UPI001CFFD8E5|nr:myb-like protein X [Drosophila ananassae]
MDTININDYTAIELREWCKCLLLPSHGNKNELAARLNKLSADHRGECPKTKHIDLIENPKILCDIPQNSNEHEIEKQQDNLSEDKPEKQKQSSKEAAEMLQGTDEMQNQKQLGDTNDETKDQLQKHNTNEETKDRQLTRNTNEEAMDQNETQKTKETVENEQKKLLGAEEASNEDQQNENGGATKEGKYCELTNERQQIASETVAMGRQLNEIREEARKREKQLQSYNERTKNEKRKKSIVYKLGDYVVVKNFDSHTGNDRYIVEDVDGFQQSRVPYSGVWASANMKPWLGWLENERDDQDNDEFELDEKEEERTNETSNENGKEQSNEMLKENEKVNEQSNRMSKENIEISLKNKPTVRIKRNEIITTNESNKNMNVNNNKSIDITTKNVTNRVSRTYNTRSKSKKS